MIDRKERKGRKAGGAMNRAPEVGEFTAESARGAKLGKE
jgi:hypothetical protein